MAPAPSPLRVLIVDDERLARDELRYVMHGHPQLQAVGEADSVRRAADLIDALKPDVVFLDVQMRGESGFDLLQAVDASLHVIFVTSYDQYAVRAFEVNALDYLLKPVDPARFTEAVRRLHRDGPRTTDDDAHLAEEDTLFLNFGMRSGFVRVADIVYIHAAADYTRVATADGREALVLRSLKRWEDRLPATPFVRVHRSTIVNTRFVTEIVPSTSNTYEVRMRPPHAPVRMSRRYAARLKGRMAEA